MACSRFIHLKSIFLETAPNFYDGTPFRANRQPERTNQMLQPVIVSLLLAEKSSLSKRKLSRSVLFFPPEGFSSL
jgi:hypothetical protein